MQIKNSWILTERQLCDCEMILDGSFSPLNGFMVEKDYQSVLKTMRLVNGKLFTIPIVLDVNEQFSQKLNIDDEIALCDKEGFQIAEMMVESIWKPDFEKEADLIYGTSDRLHPGVNYLFQHGNSIYVGGAIKKINVLLLVGSTYSLNNSFNASAIGCPIPRTPVLLGPMRACI